MSLKDFHTIFIIISILTTAFFGYWALTYYMHGSSISYLITAIVSFAATLGLCIYGFLFLKKVNPLS